MVRFFSLKGCFVWELLEPISCPPKWICFCGVVRYNGLLSSAEITNPLQLSTEHKPIGMISCQSIDDDEMMMVMLNVVRFFSLKACMCFRIKGCERGAILPFEGMFCLGFGGADELPYKRICFCWSYSL
ncbi:uncharacterized protein [Malus domestica]|uniref:uncharacterized protein n=1 Tax=Malus domestica TaxID=3750 RepID=UPI0039754212